MSARRDGALRSVDDPEAIHVAVSSATRRCGFLTIAAYHGRMTAHSDTTELWKSGRQSVRNLVCESHGPFLGTQIHLSGYPTYQELRTP